MDLTISQYSLQLNIPGACVLNEIGSLAEKVCHLHYLINRPLDVRYLDEGAENIWALEQMKKFCRHDALVKHGGRNVVV